MARILNGISLALVVTQRGLHMKLYMRLVLGLILTLSTFGNLAFAGAKYRNITFYAPAGTVNVYEYRYQGLQWAVISSGADHIVFAVNSQEAVYCANLAAAAQMRERSFVLTGISKNGTGVVASSCAIQ